MLTFEEVLCKMNQKYAESSKTALFPYILKRIFSWRIFIVDLNQSFWLFRGINKSTQPYKLRGTPGGTAEAYVTPVFNVTDFDNLVPGAEALVMGTRLLSEVNPFIYLFF